MVIATVLLAATLAGDRPRAIADASLAGPPELAADILLRLAERFPKHEKRAAWIETSIQLAPSARFPYRMVAATSPGYNTDTGVNVRWRALERGLDATSLRCRAVRLLLPVERTPAREVFAEINLRFPALTCADGMRYQADDYYATFRQVLDSGFTERERREGKPVEMLDDHVRVVSHPAQLEPLGELLLKGKLSEEDFNRIVSAYAMRIKEMTADDRTFTGATHHGLGQRIWDLIALAEKRKGPSYALVEAYRSYLVRHLTAARCADSAGDTFEAKVLANTVSLFNSSLKRWPFVEHVAPIAEEQSKPAKTEGRAEIFAFWEQPETQDFLYGLKRLRFGAGWTEVPAKPLDEEKRREAAWEAEVRDFLRHVEEGQKALGDSPVIHFHRMCYIYRALADLIPSGALRRQVIASWISFVRMSAVERESPPEWLLEAEELLRLPERDQVVAGGGPVIALYAELQQITR